MLKPDRIDRYLPMVFPSGVKVSSFAKHCPHCKTLVKAPSMDGIALLVVDRVFILATASCPQCQHEFEVKCMFDDSKQVHPVLLPAMIMRFLMQWHARQMLRKGIPLRPAESKAEPARDDVKTQEPVGLLLSAQEVIRSDELLGRYQGIPIVAWIEYQGQRYDYDRAAPDNASFRLGQHEALFEQSLIYRRRSMA